MGVSKILIANRGEIACRIIRTAQALGYATVAVFSDADAHAPHVRLGDQAVRIGPGPAKDSYLKADAIIAAAQATGATAVHPGYGFLSENEAFARAVIEAGLIFIGPPPAAIHAMGDKARAKARMVAAGVPVVPGVPIASASAAAAIGYPVMVKAVAGGGGRGMRVVRTPAALPAALDSAAREALSAFGDGALLLEKLIEHGRHIEIQVFADSHGHAVHLGERDCTAQRRRQKIIEESPSPIVTPELRARMGADAVQAALAVGYQGAGTIEFIVDSAANHYFLEMNTRLQVEHPVTELVTGLDLVEWQLRIAAGEPLPLTQDQIRFTGHAIEARLCAEDSYAGFAPQTGEILHWAPTPRPGIRIDSGIEQGSVISPFYDSMVAKIIAHGTNRADAIRRLAAAIAATPLLGPTTNAPFLTALLASDEFTQARMHTSLIDEWDAASAPILRRTPPSPATVALAAALLAAPEAGFRNRAPAEFSLTLESEGATYPLRITTNGPDITVATAETTTRITLLSADGPKIHFERDNIRAHALALHTGATLHLAAGGAIHIFSEPSPFAAATPAADPSRITAPVSGTLLSILPAGTAVAAGDIIAVIEAMKIETRLAAAAPGRIAATHAAPGAQIAAKSLLAELALEEK
jgi:geranyl-CoA carboxylase alpha subunit